MHKSIYRQFWRYTIPTVAAMLVNGLYQVVDGIFIGRYVGAQGLAAINVAWPVLGVILGIGMMVGVGAGAMTSIRLGRQDKKGAKQILATGITMLGILSPIVAGILWLCSDDFLLWQGAEGRVYDLGMQYLEILIVASVFSLGSIAFPFLLRNDNSPNFATVLMVIGALVNIILDYLFIAYLGWELKGAAIATGIAQMVVTLCGVLYFFTSKATLRLKISDLKFHFRFASRIITIGLSSLFMYAYGSIMIAVHNGLFAYYGDIGWVGAYAIVGYIVIIYYLIIEGIANGMQPLASYNYGAKNISNVNRLLKVAMISAVVGGIIFVIGLNIDPRAIVSIFNSDDASLIHQAALGLRLHLFALFLDGFLVVCAAYYQSIAMSSKALFVTLGNVLIQIPFLYLLPQSWGIEGIWLAYPLSNIALTIVVIVMMWRDVKALSADPDVNTSQ